MTRGYRGSEFCSILGLSLSREIKRDVLKEEATRLRWRGKDRDSSKEGVGGVCQTEGQAGAKALR